MANTRIAIRRSTTNSVVTGLNAGELAYTQNSSLLYVGNPNGTGVSVIGGLYNFGALSACSALVANATSGIDKIIVANLQPIYVVANGTSGTDGKILTSNSTGGIYWGSAGGSGTVTNISMGSGLTSTQSPLTTTGTMSVVANSGLTSNSSGVFINANNGITANSSGAFATSANGISVTAAGINVLGSGSILANATGTYAVGSNGISVTSAGINFAPGSSSGLVSNSSGAFVQAANGVNLTAAGINVLGSNGILANSTGTWINVNSAHFTVNASGLCVNSTGVITLQDLTCQGNLTVSGTLTTVDATNLKVKDNLIQMADGIVTSGAFADAIDVGYYVATGNTSNTVYSGMIRVAGSSTNANPYFKLFSQYDAINSTTVNATATVGTLQSYLAPWGAGGGFVVNSTAISVMANGTVAVALTANTLALATALPGTSGGTGTGTTASGDLLVGNTGNAWSRLSIGTDGQVLQTSCTSVVFASLDGGTF